MTNTVTSDNNLVKKGEVLICDGAVFFGFTEGKEYTVLAGGGDQDFVCGGEVYSDGFIVKDDEGDAVYLVYPYCTDFVWRKK